VPALPRRGGLGLRGRIVGAVLVTTVTTLVVAALALLGPLEHSLRDAEKVSLSSALGKGTINRFSRLQLDQLGTSEPQRQALLGRQRKLAGRIGATVAVLGPPDASGLPELLLPAPEEGADIDPTSKDIAHAFRFRRARIGFGSIDGTEYAQAAIPFVDPNTQSLYVLAVRKPIDEIGGAVDVVGTAFIDAALAGLALTMVLAIPLSARLARRLRRLREAALELADKGPAAQVPVDRARDEVGDLARTLATMQQRLRQQEEARRAFVATASHELRTPLTSLDGMLELLHDDLRYEQPDLADARALLARARAQSRRLGRLAADLLDLSRLDAQVEMRSEAVELGELSRAVLAEFELGTAEREIVTQLHDEGGSVWALGDPGSIARILRIMLDNALRVSPEGSELTIELHHGGDVTLSVRDQGPGVPAAEREQIFRRFERGRDTAGQAGFGLGLAIGRELAERMGGELVLERDEPPGATFTLRMPSAPSPTRTLSAAPS